MNRKYSRKISFNEKLWIAADRILPPFTNNMIIEGEGDIDLNLLQAAVNAASEANPGTRLIMSDSPVKVRWVDSGKAPCVRRADGVDWSGFQSEGAPCLTKPHHSVTEGPLCDVIIIRGNPPRLSFRTHHAIMDGRGTMFWVEDIFRALRGETIVGSHSTLTDMDLLMPSIKGPRYQNCLPPTGAASGNERGAIWIRRQVSGRFRNLVSQVAILTAAMARTHSNGTVVFNIPADRRTAEMPRSTANLSIGFYIDVPPGAPPDALADDIKKQMNQQGRNMEFLLRILYPFIPIGIMARAMQASGDRMRASNQYRLSGIISNLGKMQLEKYSFNGFQATTAFFIPLNFDALPLFITLSGSKDFIEILFGMPRILANAGRIEALADHVEAGLIRD